LDQLGLLWGILAAIAYTISLFAANRIGLELDNSKRSAFMMTGALLIVIIALLFSQKSPFDWSVFFPWGLYLAIFGTILPPIFLNKGFPLTGIGVGSILVSLEIPVSVGMAVWLLHEQVEPMQTLGIIAILFGIVVLNVKKIRFAKKRKVF
jgi:drug/metabolite transporter (DMT)-like permease